MYKWKKIKECSPENHTFVIMGNVGEVRILPVMYCCGTYKDALANDEDVEKHYTFWCDLPDEPKEQEDE